MEDVTSLIQQAEQEDNSLFGRIDRHIRLVEKDDYTMRRWDGKPVGNNSEESGVFNEHIPEARLFLRKLTEMAMGMKLNVVVEGDRTAKEQENIRNFFTDCLEDADFILFNQAKWGFIHNNFHNIFLQGWACGQYLPYTDDGVTLNCELRPLERRNLVYGASKKEIAWAAPLTRRSKYDIKLEYDHNIKDEFGAVRDYWDKDTESVFVTGSDVGYLQSNASIGQLVKENPNIWGYSPFIIHACPTGSPLSTSKGIEHRGESVFYELEHIFDDIDFMASLIKTQAYEDLRPALHKAGSGDGDPDHYPVPGSVENTDVPYSLVPRRDMTNAQRAFMNMINDFLQRAGLSAVQYGSLTFPLSGVSLMQLNQAKETIMVPRFQTMALMLQGGHRLLIKQIKAMRDGGYLENKFTVNGNEYNVDKLLKPHNIKFQFYSESLNDMITKASVGQSLRGMLPDKVILRDVFGRPNPDLDDDMLEREAAERMFPEVMMFEQMHSHITEIESENDTHDIQARMILERLKVALKQMYAQPEALKASERPEPLQAPNLLQGGGGNGQANS